MSCEEKETCTDEQDVETQGERHLQETWETAKHQAPRERRGTDSHSQPSGGTKPATILIWDL